jgi:hypothetical protein
LSIKPAARLLLFSFIALAILLAPGCSSPEVDPAGETIAEEEVPELIEPETPADEGPVESPLSSLDYYWPWLSHGHLDLSSGEVISGPDLFESDPGFITEFTGDYSFEGQLIWLVEETDLFELEWVLLSFDVEYYEQNEREFELSFEFLIDGLQPVPGDEGVREFDLNIVEQQRGFEVVINRIIFGKEQKGSFSSELIDYIALDMEMRVVGNP